MKELTLFNEKKKLTQILLSPSFERIVDRHSLNEYMLDEYTERRNKKKPSSFSKEQKEFIKQAVKRLPEVEQLIIYLRYWQDMTACEITKILKLSEANVRKIETKSLSLLKSFYENNFEASCSKSLAA